MDEQMTSIRRSRRWTAPSAVHLASLLLGLIVLIVLGRHLWFFGDDWAFVIGRRETFARGDYADYLFAPHNEHWSTIPVLIYSVLFKAFGLHSYLPYLMLALLAHLAVAALLRVVLTRNGVRPWPATAWVCIVVFLGAGAENLTWGFQVGFVGAIAFGLASLVLADHDGPLGHRDVFALLCAVFGLASSGTALTLVAATAFTLVLRSRWRSAVLHTAVPAFVYVVWYLGWGHEGRADQTNFHSDQVPPYVYRGVTNSLEALLQFRGTGGLLLLGLLVSAAVIGLDGLRRTASAWGLGSAVVVFFLIGGISRASLGIDQAAASRYVYVGAALSLPAIAVAVESLRCRIGVRVAWIVLGWALIANTAALSQFERDRLALVDSTHRLILAAASLVGEPGIDPAAQPESQYNPDLTMADLQQLVQDDDLRVPDDIEPVDRLAAAQRLLVHVEPAVDETTPTDLVAVTDSARALLTAGEPGCIVVHPAGSPAQVVLQLPDASYVLATSSSGGELVVTLRSPDGSIVAAGRSYAVSAGGTVRVDIDVASSPVINVPDSGDTVLCGVVQQ